MRFTGGPKDTQPRWSPDGRHLVFVSNRSGSNSLWLLSLEGGEARQLTRVKGGAQDLVCRTLIGEAPPSPSRPT